MEKNRALEGENMKMKDEAAELQATLRDLQSQQSIAQSLMDQKQELIVRLEGDLSNVKVWLSVERPHSAILGTFSVCSRSGRGSRCAFHVTKEN